MTPEITKEIEQKVKVKYPIIRELMKKCYSNGFNSAQGNGESEGGDFSQEYVEVEQLIDTVLTQQLEGLEEEKQEHWRKGFQSGIEAVANKSDEAIKHAQELIREIETMKTWVSPHSQTEGTYR